MNEREFENMLMQGISDMSPENKVIGRITPWKRYMRLVVVGLGLSLVHFDINMSIASAVIQLAGYIILILGLRGLRKENSGFLWGYIFVILRFALFIVQKLLDASIWQDDIIRQDTIWSGNTIGGLLLSLLICICVCIGVRAVEDKAGVAKRSKAVVALVLWYTLIIIIGLAGGVTGILASALMIAYVAIIVCLCETYNGLDRVGYVITPTNIKVPDIAVVGVILTMIAIAVIYTWSQNEYPMTWEIHEQEHSEEAKQIAEHLIELGVPKQVVDDLAIEDILACKDATLVLVQQGNWIGSDEDQSQDIVLTCVGVCLDEDKSRWKIIEHFQWSEDAEFYGTEAIMLLGSDAYYTDDKLTGKVLCDMDGQSYASEYYSLDTGENPLSLFGTSLEYTPIYGAFSFDEEAENHRGYISYNMMPEGEEIHITLEMEYYHQVDKYIYPVKTALDFIEGNSIFFMGNSFKRYEAWLQFRPSEVELP